MKCYKRLGKNKKGFTLVEIIVVLVILAVLAAFTIPTMLGFVEEAKGKALIAEAREIYVAAQATATEYIATDASMTDQKLDGLLSSDAVNVDDPEAASLTMKGYLNKDIDGTWEIEMDMTSRSASASAFRSIMMATLETYNGRVATVIYHKDGYVVTITAGGGSTVEKE